MAVARRLTLASAPVHILISRRHRGEHFGACVMRCFAYAVFATRVLLCMLKEVVVGGEEDNEEEEGAAERVFGG